MKKLVMTILNSFPGSYEINYTFYNYCDSDLDETNLILSDMNYICIKNTTLCEGIVKF